VISWINARFEISDFPVVAFLTLEDMTMKDLMMGHAASYPAPPVAGSAQLQVSLAPHTIVRIEREARAMRLTPDQLVDRALLALADEVDAARIMAVPQPGGAR
jgi:hypothetical protein